MSRFDRYTIPSVFNVLSAEQFFGTTADITNVSLTTVPTLSVLNSPIIGGSIIINGSTHTNSLTSVSLTSTNGTITNFNSNVITVSTITVLDKAVTNFNVTSISTNSYTLTNNDKSNIYHVDTTTHPSVTAILPNDLNNGFNAGLINAGTGSIIISSTQTPFIKAQNNSNINSIQYTGMLIYKTNDEFFGVGVFE
jgi:hypothetical protein